MAMRPSTEFEDLPGSLAGTAVRAVIADDSTESLALLRAMLAMIEGIEVVGTAANGLKAVESVESLQPEVVMLDIAMPLMDGLEAATVIRKGHAQTTIIVYSAYDTAKMEPAALAAGADVYVTKTANVRDLLAELQRALPDRSIVLKGGSRPTPDVHLARSGRTAEALWKERYRILLDALGEGVLITSSDGQIADANFQATQILQVPISRLIGRLLSDVGIVGDVETSRAIEAAMNTGRPASNLEYELPRSNGSSRRLLMSVRALREPADLSVREVLVSFADISKQRSSERAAAMAGERLTATLESLRDGLAILVPVRDVDGGIVDFCYDFINSAGCRLNGLSREQQIGHQLLSVLPGLRGSLLFEEYARAADLGDPRAQHSVLSLSALGGKQRTWDVSVVPAAGSIVVIFRDITHQPGARPQV